MPRSTKKFENWLTRQTMQFLLRGLSRVPDRAVAPMGVSLGAFFHAAMPHLRRRARLNLQQVYGDQRTPAELDQMVRRNFRHYGLNLAEFMVMSRWSGAELERRVELHGRDNAAAAIAVDRGAIAVTAHYGNWELLGARIAQAGYSLNVVARDADDAATNSLINQIRESTGYRIIPRRHALRQALECIERKEPVAFLLDQNTARGAIYVPFFGRPAATATGPALLAHRTGAPLVPCLTRRLPDGRHHVEIMPMLVWENSGDKDRDIAEITARLTAIIEDWIRQDPEQWLWIHNRWKQQPKG